MARMTRREKIWEGFATHLANKIADKFFEGEVAKRKAAKQDLEFEVLRKYFDPIKKIMAKLPDGIVKEDTALYVYAPPGDRRGHYANYGFRLDERQRVPDHLEVPAEVIGALHKAAGNDYELNTARHKLFNDLVNNIIVADSFEEVVSKWPEAKELAEEVSLTYATTMNVPLEKILGRYVSAIEAPKTLKQITSASNTSNGAK